MAKTTCQAWSKFIAWPYDVGTITSKPADEETKKQKM